MKTRTLLLLAVGCGLAILLAGGVLLIQLVNRTEVPPPTPIGEWARVGDMNVRVESSSEADGRIRVDLEIGGVEDADGTSGFGLNASGRRAPLVESCGATSRFLNPCTLVFEVPDDGGSRQLLYQRGDQRARWVLAVR